MVKLVGSVCILMGGGLAWWLQLQERRRRRDTLADLITVLRQMNEEIRMARTPMPELLRKLSSGCGSETAELLRTTAAAVKQGVELEAAWRREIEQLPLAPRDREILHGLRFNGDEEKLCKGISLAIYQLAQSAEELERRRSEEEKRTTALCFSSAALLVILLI